VNPGEQLREAAGAAQCPPWCVSDHAAELGEAAFYHASATDSLMISGSAGLRRVRLEIETAQYAPEDSGEGPWIRVVEIALQEGNRYRLIGLTPDEARKAARMLVQAANRIDHGVAAHPGRNLT